MDADLTASAAVGVDAHAHANAGADTGIDLGGGRQEDGHRADLVMVQRHLMRDNATCNKYLLR